MMLGVDFFCKEGIVINRKFSGSGSRKMGRLEGRKIGRVEEKMDRLRD